jgi:drug/metabolite transporter (DMT)-like permease
MFRVAILTTVAMFAFAANSVLARLALATGEAEPLSYTGIRLAAGAIVLFAIVHLRKPSRKRTSFDIRGSWRGAAALFGYAMAFSVAYMMLPTGSGALILFASVQAGMLGWAIVKGDRPGLLEWLGLAIAFAALAYLLSPGIAAPDPLGTFLMIAAGLAWAVYSLLGRGSASPLLDTAGNFVRCLPVAVILAVIGIALHVPSGPGVAYAVTSGAVASGLGYAIWYAVLPGISRTEAALVQLTVPAIAAAGGVFFAGEEVTVQLVIASFGVLGGVALALLAADRRKARAAGSARV